ncbi:MAG: CoA transferase [Pseudomonadota bacterium]
MNKDANTSGLPLSSLTVVDYSANAAGPVTAMLLGDFGARVIKVEPPSGDATRSWGSHRFGEKREFTGTYVAMNRNKSGIVLDLKIPGDAEIARELNATADVIIHSYLPGVAKKLGVDYESVSGFNDKVVHCTISGFGQDGPLRERPGFDMLLQAYAGHMSITGEPSGASVRSGPSSIDLLTGAHAAFGIMVALKDKARSGKGQAVNVSLFDTAIHMMGNHIADYTGSNKLPPKFGGHFPNMSPYGVYRASDREFYIGVSSDAMWQKFCKEIGNEELAANPLFTANIGRLKNKVELAKVLEPMFLEKMAQEWVDLAVSLSIPACLVHTIDEVAQHEQALSRQMLVSAGVGDLMMPGVPLQLSRTPGSIRQYAPGLGEHTDEILTSLKGGSRVPSV